jgi:hypothetical protein
VVTVDNHRLVISRARLATLLDFADSRVGPGHRQLPQHLQPSDLDHGGRDGPPRGRSCSTPDRSTGLDSSIRTGLAESHYYRGFRALSRLRVGARRAGPGCCRSWLRLNFFTGLGNGLGFLSHGGQVPPSGERSLCQTGPVTVGSWPAPGAATSSFVLGFVEQDGWQRPGEVSRPELGGRLAVRTQRDSMLTNLRAERRFRGRSGCRCAGRPRRAGRDAVRRPVRRRSTKCGVMR